MQNQLINNPVKHLTTKGRTVEINFEDGSISSNSDTRHSGHVWHTRLAIDENEIEY